MDAPIDNEKDTARLEWILPILDGSGDCDVRTMSLAVALAKGMEGRAAIDAAMEQCAMIKNKSRH